MGSFGRNAGYLGLVALVVLLSMVSCSQAAQRKTIPAAPRRNNTLAYKFTSWTPKNCNFSADGRGVDLVIRNRTTPYASLTSKDSWLYGSIGAWIKLIPGNSAGSVTTLYLSSKGPGHCEFDFEFLGNETGKPYLLHTNIFVNGTGGREQQIYLWFDPTTDYHYYNFQWNKDLLVLYIDSTPIRMFRNLQNIVPGFQFPRDCPMQLYLSMWDGSKWATQGGRVKIDWNAVPFVANYKNFRLNGCLAQQGNKTEIARCQRTKFASPGRRLQVIGGSRTRMLREVRQKFVKYNYCDDGKRWNYTFPPECKYNVL